MEEKQFLFLKTADLYPPSTPSNQIHSAVRRRVLAIKKRVLGDEHPDTLITASNLAYTSWFTVTTATRPAIATLTTTTTTTPTTCHGDIRHFDDVTLRTFQLRHVTAA